jgi:hypothetical protein
VKADVIEGTANGEKVSLRLDDVVQLQRDLKVNSPPGFVLCTVGGGRLVGQQRNLEGSTLNWFVTGVGEVAVPVDQVLGILRNQTLDDALTAVRNDDEIRLQNGDAVRGTVTAADEKTFTIVPTTGDPVTLTSDVIARVLIAAPAQGRPANPTPKFVVRLADGTVLPCTAVAIANDTLQIAPVGAEVRGIPIGQVVAIEHTGGPVRWLADRTPTLAVYTPFFGGTYTHRLNRSVTGGPIRVAGKTYDHGIGVHSYSKLTYAVEPGDREFRTQYAIEDALPYADVDVRIYVDDKLVHEQKSFRTGTLSPTIETDLRGAKSLTLEVDYGNGYDVQDRLNWINPAINRE